MYKSEKEREEGKKRQMSRQNEWIKNNTDRVSIVLEKGTKEKITGMGYSVNGFIREAIREKMEREG